jgi:hypothetical protein
LFFFTYGTFFSSENRRLFLLSGFDVILENSGLFSFIICASSFISLFLSEDALLKAGCLESKSDATLGRCASSGFDRLTSSDSGLKVCKILGVMSI